ncbi:MAG: chromate transporter [Candidatus Baltobacteraceae bacterium]
MKDDLAALVRHFAALSFVAVGGANAILPQIHADVVTQTHWLTTREFTELVAVAQMAPGPNFLIVPLIGWRVAGWLGALASLVAFVVPPAVLTVVVGRALARHSETRIISALRSGLPPVAAGLLIASGIVLARTNSTHVAAIVISGGVAVLASSLHVNPLWWMLLAAVTGVLFL